MTLDQIPSEHRSTIFQPIEQSIQHLKEHIFPQSTRRRQNFDLILKGGKIIVNCGWRAFLIQLAGFLSSKGFGLNPKRFSIVVPVYKESFDQFESLNNPLLTRTFFLEIVILSYNENLKVSDRIKLIKKDNNLSFSEALNDATRACSGESILFLSKDSSINKRILFNYLSKSIQHNFYISINSHLSSIFGMISLPESIGFIKMKPIGSKVSVQRAGPIFLSSDTFLVKREWIMRFGGFDDQFISEPYINNNLKFSANNLLYKFDVLTDAACIFNANPHTLKCLKKSKNSVYECEIEGEKRILRILERSTEKADQVKCEIDWIDYLADQGIPTPRAMPSVNGKRVENIERTYSSFLISSFEKASGHNIDTSNVKEWNDDLFQEWGRTMGRMHHLTKNYKPGNPNIKRNDWNMGRFFQGELDFRPEESKVLSLWSNLLDDLYSLPKDTENYGLVHNDLHYNNILISGPQIIVIDFDGCAHNWFACDIAIALYEALWTVPYSERNNFAKRLISNFFIGYNKENYLDSYWINLLPKFLKFREIYAYLIFIKDWNHETLTIGQKNILSIRKKLIETETPCIEICLDDITR